MRYAILGNTLAWRADGAVAPLAGARLRALLAALALRPGRDVPPDLLIDQVWADDPPADPAGALQALVARLRRVLGRDAIVSGPAGYRLVAEPDEVDLGVFERLAEQGDAALRAGDADQAATLLRQALALWRGPALADLPDRAVAVRPEEQRLAVLGQRIAADLKLGQAASVLPELRELVAANRLHEPLRVQLIQALREAGRPADALAEYEEARRELADTLGADPGPGLRALHQELLRGPAPAKPTAAAPAASARRPVQPDRPERPGNLRARLTSFVGREADLAAMLADLAGNRLVTLVGPGGSGKTRLAQEAARAPAGRWPDGVWLAELAALDDPRDVPGAVLTALGLRETGLHAGAESRRTEPGPVDPAQALVEHCARRDLLVILDNCEHLVQAAADLVERLLTNCPRLTVLATSREPLGVPGELARPVDPLPAGPAVRLFADRGAAARPGFRAAADPDAVAEICRRLDGLPLAIELAAARLRSLTPRQIADRLDDRFHLLTGGSRTALPRQQTLRAVVDWSWDLLTEPERALLRRLSVFSGGCTLDTAEQVCAGAGLAARDVLDLLGSLVDKSLLIAEIDLGELDGGELDASGPDASGPDAGARGEMRYRMLETIHAYAAERLREHGPAEHDAAVQAHIRCFRELTRQAAPLLRGRRQLAWLARLETEHDNVRAALRRAVARGAEQDALALVLGMNWFWSLRDYRIEAFSWFDMVGALGPDPLRDLTGPAPPVDRDPLELSPPWDAELLDEARRQVQFGRLTHRADRMDQLNDPETVALAERLSLAYHPDLPQSSRVPGVMWPFLGIYTGRFGDITDQVERAVAECRRRGRRWELALSRQLEARVKADLVGLLDQAAEAAAESHALFSALGDRWGLAEALSCQAEIAEFGGDPDQAVRLYWEGVELARQIGARQHVPMALVRISQVELSAGRLDAAEKLVRQGMDEALRVASGAWDPVTFGRLVLTVIMALTDRIAEARELIETCLAEAELGTPPPVLFALLYAVRGWLDVRDGQPRRGLARLREGSRHMAGADNTPAVSGVLRSAGYALAEVARLGEGDAVRAARQATRLLAVAARITVPVPGAHERAELRRGEAIARDVLGDAQFAAEHAHGHALTVRQAIDIAADVAS